MADDGFPVNDRERLRWYSSGLGVAALVAECMAEGMDKGASIPPHATVALRALAKMLREMRHDGHAPQGDRD
jgi:hypothetical protein